MPSNKPLRIVTYTLPNGVSPAFAPVELDEFPGPVVLTADTYPANSRQGVGTSTFALPVIIVLANTKAEVQRLLALAATGVVVGVKFPLYLNRLPLGVWAGLSAGGISTVVLPGNAFAFLTVIQNDYP